jgi:ribonuclease HI
VEQEAIISAIQKLPTTGVREVIFTDSLSTMRATSGNNHTKILKTRKIRQLMDKQKGNVTLCWVPGHAGITGNEEVNEEAKRALEELITNDKKYPLEDLSGWIKTDMAGSRLKTNQI